MYLDVAAFLRYNFRAFFKTRGEHYRLTPKRFLILFIWVVLYIPAQLVNRIFFLLDDVFYPGYRQQKVKTPVFIIGNPRSGTTFLHRLMSKDKETFTALTVWELIFAPSITQRKIIWGVIKLFRILGYPINRSLDALNKKINKGNTTHNIKLDEAEEDEHLLIHSWSTESLWPLYPFKDELLPYFFFDRDIPKPKQHKVMEFYQSMIKRHLYAHGGKMILLSKNPSHSAKIASLTEFFPDARFINLVRNPFQAMPSMLDYMSTGWKLFCDPLEPYPYKKEFFEVMNYYYLYPVEYFKDKDNKCNFIRYDDLVANPDEIIEDLYSWLGLKISDSFGTVVANETTQARQYNARHTYSIADMGLSEPQIYKEFEEVFTYFEFDSHHLELPDHVMLWQLKELPQKWKSQRLQRKSNRQIRRQQKMYARKSKKLVR